MPTGSQNGVETDPNTYPKSMQKVALKREMEIIKRLVFMKGRKLVFGARNTILLFRSERGIGEKYFLRRRCLRFSAGVPINAEMKQQCAKIQSKATKSVPKWSPNRENGAMVEAKTAQGSSKGTPAGNYRFWVPKYPPRRVLLLSRQIH